MSRFSIPTELANDPEVIALCGKMLIEEIDRTLSLAEVRCLEFDELLNRIEHLPDVDNSGGVVFRACELELSLNQAFSLAESVRRMSATVDGLPSRRKPKYDRAIRRILSRLPAEASWPVAEPWLVHKRKFRREAAYAILRKAGVDEKTGLRLLEVFEKTGDQAALELIARNPSATSALDIKQILPLVEDDYWRMRLVEAVMINDEPRALILASEFPCEFVHAVGRQKRQRLMPKMRNLFDLYSENLDYLSIYAWALGQLGALEEIGKLRKHIERMTRLA